MKLSNQIVLSSIFWCLHKNVPLRHEPITPHIQSRWIYRKLKLLFSILIQNEKDECKQIYSIPLRFLILSHWFLELYILCLLNRQSLQFGVALFPVLPNIFNLFTKNIPFNSYNKFFYLNFGSHKETSHSYKLKISLFYVKLLGQISID